MRKLRQHQYHGPDPVSFQPSSRPERLRRHPRRARVAPSVAVSGPSGSICRLAPVAVDISRDMDSLLMLILLSEPPVNLSLAQWDLPDSLSVNMNDIDVAVLTSLHLAPFPHPYPSHPYRRPSSCILHSMHNHRAFPLQYCRTCPNVSFFHAS